MISRKLLSISVLLIYLSFNFSFAGPFYDDNFIISPEVGKEVNCTFWGDEFESYIEDSNGYSIVYDTQYQRYVYATKDANGYLVPSLLLVGRDNPVGDPHLRISGDALAEADSIREVFSVPEPLDIDDLNDTRTAIILFDFVEKDYNDSLIHMGGTNDFNQDYEYYDAKLIWDYIFGIGYTEAGDPFACEINPTDEDLDINDRKFPIYSSIRQYFREISYYDGTSDDDIPCDDYDLTPYNYHSYWSDFRWIQNPQVGDTASAPGFLNPVVYTNDNNDLKWRFVYYNFGDFIEIEDPENPGTFIDTIASPTIVQNNMDPYDAIDLSKLKADSLGYDISLGVTDSMNMYYMIYAGKNRGWSGAQAGGKSFGNEEVSVGDVPGDISSGIVFANIHTHAHEMGHMIFDFRDVYHRGKMYDGTIAGIGVKHSWGIGPYGLYNCHYFTIGGGTTRYDKFNATAKPPHPCPANKIRSKVVRPTIVSNVPDTTVIMKPYALYPEVLLIEDPLNPVDTSGTSLYLGEYFLVCNRSPVDTFNYESHWPTGDGLNIFHVDNEAGGFRQADVTHRELSTEVADNQERVTYEDFEFYPSDEHDFFVPNTVDPNRSSFTHESLPSSDWNDDGINGGGPSFVNIDSISTGQNSIVTFNLDSYQNLPYLVPTYTFNPTTNPNLLNFVTGENEYTQISIKITNHGNVAFSEDSLVVTLMPLDNSLFSVDPSNNSHTYYGNIEPNETITLQYYGIKMSTLTTNKIGDFAIFEIDLNSSIMPENSIEIPISHPAENDFNMITMMGRQILTYDVNSDGNDEAIGIESNGITIMDTDGSQSTISVNSALAGAGLAIGNMLNQNENLEELLVLHADTAQVNKHRVWMYRISPTGFTSIYNSPLELFEVTDIGKLISIPVLGDLNGDGCDEMVYSIEGYGVVAVTFDSTGFDTLWTYRDSRTQATDNHKPLIADLDGDMQNEVAICLYTANNSTGDGYIVIDPDISSPNSYGVYPVDNIDSDASSSSRGFLSTGCVGDIDNDDTLEVAFTYAEWGASINAYGFNRVGVLEFTGIGFTFDQTEIDENKNPLNGEMILADLDNNSDLEILVSSGWDEKPEATIVNSLIAYDYNGSTHQIALFDTTSSWPWINDNGCPLVMVAADFKNTNESNIAAHIAGLHNDESQLHMINSNGQAVYNTDNSTFIYKFPNTQAYRYYGLAYGCNDQNMAGLYTWHRDRIIYTEAISGKTATNFDWPMRYHDAKNSSLYGPVTIPDSYIFASDRILSGEYHFAGEVTIPSGVTVTIAQGSKIYLDSSVEGKYFNVVGVLNVDGTQNRPVEFHGQDLVYSCGLKFTDQSSTFSTLEYATFNDFKYGIYFDEFTESSDHSFEYLTFNNCSNAIYTYVGTDVSIRNSTFNNCLFGIRAYTSSLHIYDCLFTNPINDAIYINGGSYSFLDDNTIIGDGYQTTNYYGIRLSRVNDFDISNLYIEGLNNTCMMLWESDGQIEDCHLKDGGIDGIYHYNSNIWMLADTLENCTRNGIYSLQSSVATIGSSGIVNNGNYQILSTNSTPPMINFFMTDYIHNDIYRSASNTKQLIYLPALTSDFHCENNYWGVPNPTSYADEFFYPDQYFIFDPYDSSKNLPGLSNTSNDTLLLAIEYLENSQFEEACSLFEWMISNSSNENDRISALRYWKGIGDIDSVTQIEKVQKLNTWILQASQNSRLRTDCEDALSRCFLNLSRFEDALAIYSERYHNATSYLDSALAEIQINYIYLDMATYYDGEGSSPLLNSVEDMDKWEELEIQLERTPSPCNTSELKPGSFTSAMSRIKELSDNICDVSSNSSELLPLEFKLATPYPNPFNPTVAIPFEIPKQSEIKIAVYNVLGQRVTTLINKPMNAGYHKILWNGRDLYGTPIASGVYFVKMSAPNYNKTRKIVMLK